MRLASVLGQSQIYRCTLSPMPTDMCYVHFCITRHSTSCARALALSVAMDESSLSPTRELVLQDAEDMKQFTKQELESLIGVDAREALRHNLTRSEEWLSTVSVQKRAHDNADSVGRAATALDGRLDMALDGSASAGAASCLRAPLAPHASCGRCFASESPPTARTQLHDALVRCTARLRKQSDASNLTPATSPTERSGQRVQTSLPC